MTLSDLPAIYGILTLMLVLTSGGFSGLFTPNHANLIKLVLGPRFISEG